jgi:hypothetical protein
LSIFFKGKWSVVCSEGSSDESTSTNVFWSEHGYGYDEEKSFDDHTSGVEIKLEFDATLSLDFGSYSLLVIILFANYEMPY